MAPLFDASIRRRLLAQHSGWDLVAASIHRESMPPHSDLLQRATRMNFAN